MNKETIFEQEGRSFPGKTYAQAVLSPAFEAAKQHLLEPMLAVNKAHLIMLAEEGLICREDTKSIMHAILALDVEAVRRSSYTGEFEDLFFQVEHMLLQTAGDIAGNLHLARSRNDMGVAMYRMALREKALAAIASLVTLQEVLLRVAREHAATVMLAHTHTQQAQPTTLAHYLLGVFDSFDRDVKRLKAAYHNCNRSPLGAAAITTSGFPINRERVAELLAFDEIIENSYDAIGGGDYLGELASALQISLLGMGRFVQDLLLWSTQEYGAVIVSDPYVQISSIMPQKRNPVSFEHIRSLSSAAQGLMASVHTMLHNTPYGDIVDTEDDMQPYLWQGLYLAGQLYRLLAMVVGTMEVNRELLLNRAKNSLATITELADTLVRECGLPFRTAHTIAARTGKMAMAKGLKPYEITAAMLDDIAQEAIGRKLSIDAEKLADALDPVHFVAIRSLPGGPAEPEVARMLAKRNAVCAGNRIWLDERRQAIQSAICRVDELANQWCEQP